MLHKLKLSNCPMLSYMPQLSVLTLLSLKEIKEDDQLNITQLQSLLSYMHDLMHLHLQNALCDANHFLAKINFDVTQKFTLLHLSHLLIAALLSTIVAFLSCFKLPSKTKMILSCYGAIYPYSKAQCDEEWSSLYPLLTQKLCLFEDQALISPTICTFSIDYRDMEFVFSSSEHYSQFPPSTYAPKPYWDCNIHLQLHIKSVKQTLDCITSNICHSVSSKDVQSVHLHNFYDSSISSWKSSLVHFQEVRHLKVTGCSIAGLASALCLASRDDVENQDNSEHGSQHLLCAPALEELECTSCHIDAEQDVLSFHTALFVRKERGRALKPLVIKNFARSQFLPEDVLGLPVNEIGLNSKSL